MAVTTPADLTAPAPGFDHRESGSPESAWRSSRLIADATVLNLAGVRRLVVLAAHPDDETLGTAGLLARAHRLSIPVTVVVASDGEASHPGSPTHPPERLGVLRRDEVAAAVAHLAPDAALIHLGLPDGGLLGAGPELGTAMADAVRGLTTDDLIAAPWRGDRHPDHEAVAVAAEELSATSGARLVEYPIWAWHWADPAASELARLRWAAVDLSGAERAAKGRALLEHRTQTQRLSPAPADEPLLRPEFLEHFQRSRELFVVVADPAASDVAPGAGSLPGDYFDGLYATQPDPWSFETRWYEHRKRAVLLASLPRQRFGSAFEAGCSNGALTVGLADRCDRVLAVDIAGAPLDVARRRLDDRRSVIFERRRLPQDWPSAATFDLIVLSEVGYYCGAADLDLLVRRAVGSLAGGGAIVACHWRHPVADYPLTGDQVHAALLARSGLLIQVSHFEEDFRLDVLVDPSTPSIARREGLVS